MIDQLLKPLTEQHVRARSLWAAAGWLGWLALVTLLAALLGLMMVFRDLGWAAAAWIVFLGGLVAILYQPRYGLYLIIFFALLGDAYLWPWYPFVKNFSSQESIFYINDALIINPLEVYIVFTIGSWLIRGLARKNIRFYRGALFWPGLVFLGFVLFGFVYGFYKQGDMVVGLWELRPVVYMLLLLFISSNLLERQQHFIHLMWIVVAALFVEGLAGTGYYLFVLHRNLYNISQITEHAVGIHMNSVFVFAMGLWLYRTSRLKRFAILAALPVMIVTYLATQRRSAFMTLMVAVAFILFLLYLEHRRIFWVITPPLLLVTAAYFAIFWNAQRGLLTLPVEAVKSVVAPFAANLRDQASNHYRIIENYNLSVTVHAHPLIGIGFGQKFYVAVPMPDISFFTWWQYLPHNSIIWVWLKAGVFGFLAFLFLVGAALMQSAQTVRRLPQTEIRAVMLAGSLYLFMHFIYAYADISWDARSMIYIGAVMGMTNCLVHALSQPAPVAPKRWPWQPDPQPEPAVLPLPDEDLGPSPDFRSARPL